MNRNSPALSSDSASVQDYVKAIYASTEWRDQPVTSSQLAVRLGVANSSVSGMVRKLVDLGLAVHEPYSAIELTAEGHRLALAMVRRHRLLETFLVQELGYAWDEVHDEAELLEHTVSDTFIERLANKLGHPERDPHGDPIPAADGTVDVPEANQLGRLDPGHTGHIIRISDANPDLLRFLSAERISLDSRVEVMGHRPFGGPLVVRIGSAEHLRELDLGDEAAAALWVANDTPHENCLLRT
ncbi:DtxR family iron dependent repressor [Arthrobacter crystallopoietes BAB-32]|uniref:Manganese transport regulator n=1 Tax=Arthrobacter crystallopoietes BAB-32 TaxID=1246476 RepID=N1V1P4_9MICC|nr:metal-dependent transcriptional regulator [Arthrobacter crystallopoietes]EMY33997.1 DtxR family iron dependent repressor [Arthrobacter crystallopoietes BAB-32]